MHIRGTVLLALEVSRIGAALTIILCFVAIRALCLTIHATSAIKVKV